MLLYCIVKSTVQKMKRKLNVVVVNNSSIQTPGIHNLLKHYDDYVSIDRIRDGWEMISQTGETSPDLVVMDNNIPGDSGIELLVGIRMKHPKAKVFFYTHDSEPYYRNMCNLLGADYFCGHSPTLSALPESLKLTILNYQIQS
jgi:two-component system, NarL family, invasion response regulator UvrY